MWIRIALPVYWLVLALATHYPSVRVPGEVPKSDKIVHFVAFGLLAALFWQWMRARSRPLTASSVWIAALVLVSYATLDEYTQQFVGRDTDIWDWAANISGITCALVLGEIRRRRSRLRED